MDAPWDDATDSPLQIEPVSMEFRDASKPYVGRWNRLISQTNWEKGRIIFEWRTALEEAGAPASAYSDEAWARQVGGVTPQHVGRLRRVFYRFGEVQSEFPGLYWSHFQVALDWEDAEMWLEGAVQNGWSVAQMRKQRAETLGLVEDVLAPVETAVELDEDFAEPRDVPTTSDHAPASSAKSGTSTSPSAISAEESRAASPEAVENESGDSRSEDIPGASVRPFADLPTLPDDLQDALEAFKLAILRHKSSEWEDVSPSDVLSALQALEALVTAP